METLKYPGTITNCKIVMCFKVNLLITSYVYIYVKIGYISIS